MSNRAHRRKRAVPRAAAIRYAGIDNLIRGCNCNPDIRVWHDDDGFTRTSIAHDDWCGVIAQGPRSSIVIVPLDRGDEHR